MRPDARTVRRVSSSSSRATFSVGHTSVTVYLLQMTDLTRVRGGPILLLTLTMVAASPLRTPSRPSIEHVGKWPLHVNKVLLSYEWGCEDALRCFHGGARIQFQATGVSKRSPPARIRGIPRIRISAQVVARSAESVPPRAEPLILQIDLELTSAAEDSSSGASAPQVLLRKRIEGFDERLDDKP